MRDWRYSTAYLAAQHEPSRLSLYLALFYPWVLVVAGLYPFAGWRDSGTPIWEFLFYPWPYYISWFDNLANVVAYLPLGAALWFVLRRRMHPVWALLAAGLGGAALSTTVEALQMYLPLRRASNLDVLTNTSGALLGAAIVWALPRGLLSRTLLALRYRLFLGGHLADMGLTLVVIWLLIQINPTIPLFGVVAIPEGLPQAFQAPVEDPALFLQGLESAGAMLNLLAAGTLLVLQLNRVQRPMLAVLALVGAATAIKMVTSGVLLKPDEFFRWINWNVAAGAGIGVLLLRGVVRLQRCPQSAVCALAVIAQLLIIWAWPLQENWLAELALFRWRQGHLLTMNGVTAFLADVWPYVTLLYATLYCRWYRRHHDNNVVP